METLALQLLTLFGASLCTPSASESGAWEQWRGPVRDGSFAGPAWPDQFGEEHLSELWRVEDLGPSYSGPIVTADRVFTVETRDEVEEVVRAVDRATGEELWTASWDGSIEVPFFAASNGSWIRATPAYDDGALYVAGMRDVLVRLDADTGEVEWTVDFTERYDAPLPSFGFVSSPLVVGDHLYVQAGASFVKLDKASGEEVWRSLTAVGGMDSAFSSPMLAEIAGVEQLLVQTRSHMTGVAIEDGAVLWSVEIPSFRGMNILTPQPVGGAVFTAPYGGRAQLLEVTHEEGAWSVDRAWTNGAQGYMTSPVVHEGHAYLFLRSNRFACIDLATGEDVWTSGPTGDSYWSLVRQDGRILALSDSGVLRLIAADPAEYRVLDEVEAVDGLTWAHLAPAGNELFVREQGALIAFRWE